MSESKTLSELAGETSIPERTIRFYIAKGLIPGPVKAGRGAAYSSEHASRLKEIQRLQGEGRTLAEIAARIDGPARAAAPEPTPWWQHALGQDVLVWVRGDASPWRRKQINAALDEFAARVVERTEEE